ncbi:MAG: GNAT family N-acetyltransferase [Deltaproteobacteria bacterium]|nr:GNAT family N-acetyltransferase [Deltaproteobacteria bacterium]
MHIRSLGLSTELQLAATRSRLTDRGDYVVVVTPDEPGYFFGNLLVLPAAPQVGEVTYWSRKFAEELGGVPIRHITFRWDGIAGDVGARAELEAAGFTLEVTDVMTAPATAGAGAIPNRALHRRAISPVTIRALTPDEVIATADIAFANADRHDDAYRQFLDRRALWKASLVDKGSARFYGAFDDDVLVGSLGLVALGEVARFQDVEVAASHRKRGIASALLAAAAANAPADTLVIVALSGSDAARVYERAGFRVIERTASACRYPG